MTRLEERIDTLSAIEELNVTIVVLDSCTEAATDELTKFALELNMVILCASEEELSDIACSIVVIADANDALSTTTVLDSMVCILCAREELSVLRVISVTVMDDANEELFIMTLDDISVIRSANDELNVFRAVST